MLLEVKNLSSGYGTKETLRNVSLNVNQGEVIVVAGHNGAGKTTLLNTIHGILPAKNGSIVFSGKDITNKSPKEKVKQGLCLVPQGSGVFRDLSVLENLRLVAYLKSGKESNHSLSEAFDFFPILKNLVARLAGTLSGGERQMLGVAMSLVIGSSLIMLDEPSIGLSPIATEEVLHQIKEMNQKTSRSVLLVEENIQRAMSISNRIYILKTGRVTVEENIEIFAQRENYWDLY